MSDSPSKPSADAGDQRDALMEAKKKAHEKQPGEMKDQAVDDKVVEIRPGADGGAAPIQGLDTK